ncbi:MAG: PAS domain-containing protein [Planctomycetes bacterium]|nr:PAS domain-containing protein [Planctomycetota bacterium]
MSKPWRDLSSEERLRRQNQALVRLAQSNRFERAGIEAAISEIVEVAAETLEIERVGVWLFDTTQEKLRCVDLYERKSRRHSSGVEIQRSTYPRYFACIVENRALAADDARSDSRTSEFRDSYLEPLGITSLLDAPIREAGRFVGIVCHEHVGPPRAWTPEEQSFASSVADAVAFARELEERRKALEALRRSEATTQAFLAAIPDLVFRIGRDGVYRATKPMTSFRAYVDPHSCVGRSISEMLPKPVAERLLAAIEQAFRTTSTVAVEYELPVEGETRYFESRYVVCAEDEVLSIVRDITDRKRSEADREAEHRRLQQILDGVPDEIWILDREGRVVDSNATARRRSGLGMEEVRGLTIRDLAPSWDDVELRHQQTLDVVESAKPRLRSLESQTVHGQTRWLMVDKCPLFNERREVSGVLVAIHDITELRRAEDQLYHAQRLESIGRLAGGVAHDFNNLITAIQGFAQMASESLPAEAPAQVDLQQISDAAARASGLTKQLLSFAQKKPGAPRLHDVNDVVRRLERLLRGLLPDEAALRVRLAPALHPVYVDAGQIEQLLVNLVLNGRDAMPGGGQLTIETREVNLTSSDARKARQAEPGEYVEISVTDTGAGIDPRLHQQIFEPFYTTKKPGAGTGLGLAICEGIVRLAGGHIALESEVGCGARFRVRLPFSEGVATTGDPKPAPLKSVEGRERVLIVEDDDQVRRMMVQMLAPLGYMITEAAGPEEALTASLRSNGQSFDLVVSDVVMPGMSGFDLVRRLRERLPSLRALLVSGYNEEPVPGGLGESKSVAFLSKPFQGRELAERVRALLDAGA